MSKTSPVQYSDLQNFFKNFYNTECALNAKTVSEPASADSYYVGEDMTPVSYDVSFLTCRTSQKDLPQFTLRIREDAPMLAGADFDCLRLEKGGLSCYSPANDFSFVLEQKDDNLAIASGHYVSYPDTWANRSLILNHFLRSVSFDDFWIPASW